MDENEKFVRSVWEHMIYRDSALSVPCGPHYVILSSRENGWGKVFGGFYRRTKKEAWSAAADFTRQRLEEVRQVRYEISLLKLIHVQGGWGEIDGEADKAAILRTVSRLESVFIEKTHGMKEGSWK